MHETAADDVHYSKMTADRIVKILNVVVAGKNIAYAALSEEKDTMDLIIFIENVFVSLKVHGFQKRADVCNEAPTLTLQEKDPFVSLLVDK